MINLRHGFSSSRKIKNLLFFVASLSALSFIPSSIDWEMDIIRRIKTYQAIMRQEKLFVQTDRPIYVAGEEIWFSAFLLNASNSQPNQTETVLYVELIKPNGSIATKDIFKLDNGRVNGSIQLKPSLDKGEYLLVAYTNWMRNFGSDFYFRKTISIVADRESENNTPTKDELGDGTQNASNTFDQQAPIALGLPVALTFYPEGGDLVQGIASKVAFEGLTTTGAPAQFEGTIEDNEGNIVCAIGPMWQGKGFFNITPETGKTYKALLNAADGSKQQFPLPLAKAEGLKLGLESVTAEKIVFSVAKTSDSNTEEPVFLLGLQNGVPIAGLKGKLVNGATTFTVETSDFKTGVTQFTLFDNKQLPRCERLVFINKNDALQLSINAIDLPKQPRDKVEMELIATDSNGKPVLGDFAVSVTDAVRIPDNAYRSSDIYQYLTLLSDLPVGLARPTFLFDQSRKAKLMTDLLMMTNGWRRYDWQKVLAEKVNMPEFLEEPGIYVKGTLLRKSTLKPAPLGIDVTMFIGKNRSIFNQKTDANGSFTFLLGNLTDTVSAMIQTKNRMDMQSDFVLELTSNLKSKPSDKYSRLISVQNDETGSIQGSAASSTNVSISKGELTTQLTRAIKNDFFQDTTDVTIDEVTVVADRFKTEKERITQQYGAPDFSVSKKKIDNLVEENPWQFGLMSIIGDAFPGLYIDLRDSEASIPRLSNGAPDPLGSYTNNEGSVLTFRLQNKMPHRFFIFVDGEMVGATDDNGKLAYMLNLYTIEELVSMDPEVVDAIDLVFPKKGKMGDVLQSDALKGQSISAMANEKGSFGEPNDWRQDVQSANRSEDGEVDQSMSSLSTFEVPQAYLSPEAILSIYTINGGGLRAKTRYKGITNLTVRGFTKSKEFYKPVYGSGEPSTIISDLRNTLAWFPSIKTDSTGKARFDFYTSDVAQSMRVEVNGITQSGLAGSLIKTFDATEFSIPAPSVAIDASLNIDASVPIALTGFMVTMPNGEACAYAHVSVPQKGWSTYTNTFGWCYIDTTKVMPNDRLLVSKPGQGSAEPVLSSIKNKSLALTTITPQPSPTDVMDIMKGVWTNKFRNRNGNNYFRNGIFREQVKVGNDLMRLTDLLFLQRWPSLTNNSVTVDTRLLDGRRFRTENYNTSIGFEPQNRYNDAVPLVDPFFSKLSFLDRSFAKNYKFELKGTVQHQGRSMYLIEFDQTEKTEWVFYKGSMLVDAQTYGVAWAQWAVSDKAADLVMPDQYLAVGGDQKTFKLVSENNEMAWSYNNEIWEPCHAVVQVAFSQNGKAKSYLREMVWMPPYTQTEKYKGLTESEMKKRNMLLKTPTYNPSKWRMPWFLPIDNYLTEQIKYLNEVTYFSEPDTK